MLKNIINYIFIYIISFIFIGCDVCETVGGCNDSCGYCYLDLDIPTLILDDNGYYHLDYNDGALQTFSMAEAWIGYSYEYVGWTSDTYFEACTWGNCQDVSIINGSGYSDMDGYARQMIGVYESNIGDTATIWAGYYDEYGNQWLESIKVIIDE